MASEQIIVEYKAQIEGFRAELRSAVESLKSVETQSKKSAEKSTKEFQNAGTSIKQTATEIASSLGLAFGVAAIANFTKEAVQLAAKAEGIRTAFDKLNRPTLLDDLRKATKGTVSDLELMKSAVQANNFKLPLDQLSGLFKFASQRARETGESVDYLTQSIVLGISRKSIPILDNLGISSVQIQKEFKKTGDFAVAVGNIVNAELEKQGDAAVTTADKVARLAATYENLKTSFGEYIATQGNDALDFFDLFSKGFDTTVTKKALATLQAEYQKTNGLIVEDSRKSELSRLNNIAAISKQIVDLYAKRAEEVIDEDTGEFRRRTAMEIAFIDSKIKNNKNLRDQLKNLNKVAPVELTEDEKKAQEKAVEIREDALKKLQELEIKADEANLKQLTKSEAEKIEVERGFALQSVLIAEKAAIDAGVRRSDAEAISLNARQSINATYDKLILDNSVKLYNESADKENEIADARDKNLRELRGAQAEYEVKVNKDKNDQKLADDKKHEDDKKKIQQASFDFILTSINAIYQIQQNQIQSELNGLQEKKDADLSILDEQLSNRIITQEQYEQKKKGIEDKNRERERQIKIRAFEAEREASIIQALIATAVAVVKAAPNPYLMAFAAATGFAQVAVIGSQPTPKFAKGVVNLQGEGTTTSDSIHAMLSKGESVVTAEATSMHKGLLEAMNKKQGEKYIQDYYIAPILKAQLKKNSETKDSSFASNIANSLALHSSFKDGNLLDSLKQSRRSERENFTQLIKVITSSKPKRNW